VFAAISDAEAAVAAVDVDGPTGEYDDGDDGAA